MQKLGVLKLVAVTLLGFVFNQLLVNHFNELSPDYERSSRSDKVMSGPARQSELVNIHNTRCRGGGGYLVQGSTVIIQMTK